MQKLNKTFFKILIFLGLSILVVAFLINKIQLQYSDFSVTTPSGQTFKIDFPLHMQSQESGTYKLKGIAHKNNFTNTKLQIIPDDEILSLSINNQLIDISHVPQSARRDYRNGFILNLKDHLKNGENNIEIIFSDTGGMMGINLKSLYGESLSKLLLILFGLLISLLILRAKLNMTFKVLLIAGLFIRLFYFSITPPDTRTHDQSEHLDYSKYLSIHWTPPSIDHAVDGAYFHPPLYYYTGAITLKISQAFGPISDSTSQRIQQLLSLAYGMGFVFFGLLIIKQTLEFRPIKKTSLPPPFFIDKSIYKRSPQQGDQLNKKLLALITKPATQEASLDSSNPSNPSRLDNLHKLLFLVIGSMFIFWPSSVVHSVRIGNDPLLYFLYAASLYYIIQWSRSDSKKELLIASLLTAATILTKANGEILIAVLGVIGLYKMIKTKEWKKYLQLAIAPGLILLVALAITVGPGLILKLQGKRDQLYIDDINNVSSALRVGNSAVNFVWFDAKIFVTEPYTSPWEDQKGRQYFMNYLGKTGLFGEFNYGGSISHNAATINSLLAILMTWYIIFGVYQMNKKDFKKQSTLLLSGFFLLAGITYMRMTFPVNVDFRYILPILITYCALYAQSILAFGRIGAFRMAYTGIVISLIFTIVNITFILGIR
jgi:hypothetical protein